MWLAPFQKLTHINPLIFRKEFRNVNFSLLLVNLTIDEENLIAWSLSSYDHELNVDIWKWIKLIKIVEVEKESDFFLKLWIRENSKSGEKFKRVYQPVVVGVPNLKFGLLAASEDFWKFRGVDGETLTDTLKGSVILS